MVKKLKWNLVLMSLLYLGLGVFLLMEPGTALNIVCYALGGVVLACAAVQLVRYFVGGARCVPEPAHPDLRHRLSGAGCFPHHPQRYRGEHPAHRVRPVRHL